MNSLVVGLSASVGDHHGRQWNYPQGIAGIDSLPGLHGLAAFPATRRDPHSRSRQTGDGSVRFVD